MKLLASYAIIALMGLTNIVPQVTYPVEHVQSQPEIIQVEDEPAIQTLIKKYAKEYKVSPEALNATIRKETGGTYNTDIQSKLRYKKINPRWLKRCPGLKIGDRERSYGLAQIHICDHSVTIKQAKDPDFAIKFMAYNFSKGRQNWWMGYTSK